MNNLPCIRIDNDQIMKELIVIQRCIWPIIAKTMVTLKEIILTKDYYYTLQ